MDVIALVLSVVALAAIVIGNLFLRGYFRSYVAEKGKNLASKEDLAQLTHLVEGVKALHTAETERLKASLVSEGQVTERRRRVYEEVCAALRIFIDGHGRTDEAKERFHSAYAIAWLWASDGVLAALNQFIKIQVQQTANPGSVAQAEMKSAYVSIVIAMRKDVGFEATSAEASDYRFIQF